MWVLLLTAGTPGPGVAGNPSLALVDTTLVDTVSAGNVSIVMLPQTINGTPMREYRPMRIPAMGWMVDDSFFWRVPEEAVGNYRFEFLGISSAGPQSVYLRVFVRAPDA